MCQRRDMRPPHLVPATATIVTLDVTLAGEQSVTLESPARERRSGREGNEVDEVEDPPISPGQGNSVTLRLTPRFTRTRTHAHAYARVTSRHKSLYLDYGNRPRTELPQQQ